MFFVQLSPQGNICIKGQLVARLPVGVVEGDGSPIRDDENLPIRNVLHAGDRGIKR